MIPLHINCHNNEVEVCDYYMHNDCTSECAYARDVEGINSRAGGDPGLVQRLEELKKECDDDGARVV